MKQQSKVKVGGGGGGGGGGMRGFSWQSDLDSIAISYLWYF